MNKLSKNSINKKSINLTLAAISFIIFGGLGLVFMTQMEILPGWAVSTGETDLITKTLESDDINNDFSKDLVVYGYRGYDEENPNRSPKYGRIMGLNSQNGAILWDKTYNNPILKAFKIMDVNSDGISDYFISKGIVADEWNENNYFNFLDNQYSNFLMSGSNGAVNLSESGGFVNFSSYKVLDLVYFQNLEDQYEDFILIEEEVLDNSYQTYISGYYFDGTLKYRHNITFEDEFYGHNENNDKIALFEYNNDQELLMYGGQTLSLIDLKETFKFDLIYNLNFSDNIREVKIINDLNEDGISEIIVGLSSGSLIVLNGINGERLYDIPLDQNFWDINIEGVDVSKDRGSILKIDLFQINEQSFETAIAHTYILSLNVDSWNNIWNYSRIVQEKGKISQVINDIDGDSQSEIIVYELYDPTYSTSEISRYKIFNFYENQLLGVINTEVSPISMMEIPDFNSDGRMDLVITSYGDIVGISSQIPKALYQSSVFPLNIPIFIAVIILLIIGIIIILKEIKNLEFNRELISRNKLAVSINILSIVLITISFLLFLTLINVFNSTLITGFWNTNIVLIFIWVTIIWYGLLPLTAAIYNQYAPKFAFFFIRLREIFFKISKNYEHEILILDMGKRDELGTITKIKRVILPLLLSISIGFYIYNTFAPLLGFPQGFERFSSQDFFQFIIGYNLLCTLPMIFSYLLFSFFIAGNFLLDDAGIVYFKRQKKYRKPGDIEPISVWAQSLIRGIAGISAILTFTAFFYSVDFSGFFSEDLSLALMGFFMVISIFWGNPFLTGFSYILLSVEIMDYSNKQNSQKLYEKMEKKGYNTQARDITNIYPSERNN